MEKGPNQKIRKYENRGMKNSFLGFRFEKRNEGHRKGKVHEIFHHLQVLRMDYYLCQRVCGFGTKCETGVSREGWFTTLQKVCKNYILIMERLKAIQR